jgi:hypothetical protein
VDEGRSNNGPAPAGQSFLVLFVPFGITIKIFMLTNGMPGNNFLG